MKLKKIASLALAGIMAVSMLAGCKDGGNSNSGSSSENTNTTSGYSAMLGQKAADTLSKADNADLFTFADNADDQKALKKAVASLDQKTVLDFVENYTIENLGEATKGVRAGIQDDFQTEAGVKREIANTGWFGADTIDSRKIGDVWVANDDIAMDNVLTTIFDSYKSYFESEDGKGTLAGGEKVSYDFDVAVSVVNVPLSIYNDYTGSVNFIAVTVTRTATYA